MGKVEVIVEDGGEEGGGEEGFLEVEGEWETVGVVEIRDAV